MTKTLDDFIKENDGDVVKAMKAFFLYKKTKIQKL